MLLDYVSAIRTVIASRDYVLEDLESRIDTLWLEGRLTEEQRAELKRLAAEGARDELQIDVIAKIAELERRIYDLEWPTEQYPVWQKGQTSIKGQVYRADVTNDGELDLVRYDGGRASTSLSIGKIEGWHMLSRELEVVATISKDADGNYVITPIPEPEPEPSPEPVVDEGDTDGEEA